MPADANSSPNVPDLQQRVDELAAELRARSADYQEALLREAAVTEVLQVINSSPSNLTPVFDAMLERALRLCQASCGHFRTFDGELLRVVAIRGVPDAYAEFLRTTPVPLSSENQLGRILRGEQVVVSVNAADEEPYRAGDPLRRAFVDLGGARTAVTVALAKDKRLLGILTVYRQEVRQFTDKQIALVQNFAAQAVIAMENTRLLTEQREALERQTATTEVLETINRSPGDLQPVFEAILSKAMMLCDAAFGTLATFDGQRLHTMATRGVPEAFTLFRLSNPPDYGPGTGPARLIAGEAYVHDVDAADSEAYRQGDANRRAIVDLGGARTILNVALRKDDALLGTLSIYRQEVRPFNDDQIALLQGFAAQAVIAMENARLINEQREALEQQTATTEVLQVINSSPGDLTPVFEAILENAHRLCGVAYGSLQLYDGARVRAVAVHGLAESHAQRLRDGYTPGPNYPSQRLIEGAPFAHISDMAEIDDPLARAAVELSGVRTTLFCPLRKDDELLGQIVAARREIRPFSDKEIALLQNFAAQAAIAMENARLLGELRLRTDDLTESLEYQTATSELLEVISRSAANIQPVLDTMLASATRLCAARAGTVAVRQGDVFRRLAVLGYTPEAEQALRSQPVRPGRDTVSGRVLLDRKVVQIADLAADPEFAVPELVHLDDFRTTLGVPLLRDDEPIGAIAVTRNRVEPFTERQIELIRTFADQAVIAMENARLLGELRESLDQQTATSDVLKTISRSSVGLEAVLHTLVETVARLCRADQAYMYRRRDDLHHLVAAHGTSDEALGYLRANPFEPNEGTLSGRVVLQRKTVHIHDVVRDEKYTYDAPRVAGFRTMLGIPLLAQDNMVGVFILTRTQVDPFTDKEIALATGFADQAVIAIENARLFEELRDRQAELRVTFDNMGDGVAMFDAEPRLAAWNRNFEQIIGLPDALLAERPSYADYLRLLAERGEFGTENVEAELASRLENTDRELRLERTRADGTVIEVRRNAVPAGGFVLIYSDVTEQRQAEAEIRAARDAAEAALERQTATADILKVIASSPTDVQPVLDAVVKAAVQFCGATDAMIQLRDGDSVISRAHEGPLTYSGGVRRSLDRSAAGGRAIVDGRTCHLPDIGALDPVDFVTGRRLAAQHGFRATVAAPLMREDIAIGAVILRKVEVGPYTPQQIALLETFAAQAVIAIENVRLFTELRESLEQQTASAEILQVISQSPTDVAPVLQAVVAAALRFCGAEDAVIGLREGDKVVVAAHQGPIEAHIGTARELRPDLAMTRAILDSQTIELPDMSALDPGEYATAIANSKAYGFKAALATPMLREDGAIGSLMLRKKEIGAFTPRQIALLETFAAQAVIAIENVRLFTELRDSLERLKAAQANLIQSEKMASLGQLTAGIAHEIKNPLNFVNNFAGLSSELLDELKQAVDALLAEPDEDKRAELQETMDLLTGNLGKIVEHGQRADGIVKSMLAHSRGGTGDWQVSNINALVEEALNLAYHGARAQDKDFNVTLERDFAETTPIEVVPQDVTRVFLNLFGNGFYAAKKRQTSGAGSGYRPTLTVSTRDLGEAVEIRVRDNGTGVSPEVRAKLFQPFFTTKPTGEGTGLGLSISYDIVTQQHGGSIDVESDAGSFTEFTVRLPRRRRAA
jgi:PAS domain S-box-containing protein